MNWKQLLSSQRLGLETEEGRKDARTEFQRDYDRLIFSAAFRRLQNKTQVFPLPGSIFVHNRLTHSLEVSSVGRSLGNDSARLLAARHPELADTQLTELGSIVSAACLAHDLGNPPFGHSGERAIATFFSEGEGRHLRFSGGFPAGNHPALSAELASGGFPAGNHPALSAELASGGFPTGNHPALSAESASGGFPAGNPPALSATQWNDLTHFDGNANAFRLLTHQFEGRRPGGFVMTYSTLASIVKYPFSSDSAGERQKFGFFHAERPYYLRIAEALGIPRIPTADAETYARYPLVYLVEAADDICYIVMDIEDAHKLRILSTAETKELFMAFFTPQRQNEIRRELSRLDVQDVNEQVAYLRSCVINTLERECVTAFVDGEADILAGTFNGTLIQHIGHPARAAYEACQQTSERRIYHSKEVVDVELAGFHVITSLMGVMVEAALHPERAYSQLLLNRVPRQYEMRAERLYDRLMAVVDYISGMTDVYALELYRKLNGMSGPIV